MGHAALVRAIRGQDRPRKITAPVGCLARLGITPEEYIRRVEAGLKRCYFHKDWHRVEEFSNAADTFDGKQAYCRKAGKEYARRRAEARQGIEFRLEVNRQVMAALKSRGVSKYEVARRLGVNRANLTALFKPDNNWKIETLFNTVIAIGAEIEIKIR